MNTTELTEVGREGGRWWRQRLVVILGLIAVSAIAIGAVQLRPPGRSPSPAQAVHISVAPGPTYPAALIHRIIARDERPQPDRAPR